MLTLSESGAKSLGISRVISDPLESREVKNISDDSLKRLLDGISHATAAEPNVNIKGNILNKGKMTGYQFHCKTLWMSAENPVYIGVAGIIFLTEHI